MLPGIIVYVYLGTAMTNIGALFDSQSGGAIVNIIIFSVGLVFAIAAVVAIAIYTKRELNKVILQKKKDDLEKEEGGNNDDEEQNQEERQLSRRDDMSSGEDKSEDEPDSLPPIDGFMSRLPEGEDTTPETLKIGSNKAKGGNDESSSDEGINRKESNSVSVLSRSSIIKNPELSIQAAERLPISHDSHIDSS
jgi:hypothetical protein